MVIRCVSVWGVVIAAFALVAVPSRAEEVEVNPARCQLLVADRNVTTSVDELSECMHFFWHHGEFDERVGSFHSFLTLGYRSLDLDAKQAELYTVMSWMLWSKYATWVKNPEQMPDGEGGAREAIALLERGGKVFPRDAAYWLDAVKTTFPLAKHYLGSHFWKIIDWNLKADRWGNREQKIRARLDIGHAFRFLGERVRAIAAYRRVLKLDRENPVALRELAELEANPGAP